MAFGAGHLPASFTCLFLQIQVHRQWIHTLPHICRALSSIFFNCMITQVHITPRAASDGVVVNVYVQDREVVKVQIDASIVKAYGSLLHGKTVAEALKLAPGICAICGGSHLYSATAAIDRIFQSVIPPNAVLLRSIAQAAEIFQNIPRWFYASFAPEMTHSQWAHFSNHAAVVKRFAPYIGSSYQQGLLASNHAVSLYSLFGGQWPLSSFMVPGGVLCQPQKADIEKALDILQTIRKQWLEPVWLGGPCEEYLQVRSWQELQTYVSAKKSRMNSDLRLFVDAAIQYGMAEMGKSPSQFIAAGTFEQAFAGVDPKQSTTDRLICPAGFYNEGHYQPFEETQWNLSDGQALLKGAPAHTKGSGNGLLPAFGGATAETGPLARMVMQANPVLGPHQLSDPLFGDLILAFGSSVFTRALARMHEAPKLLLLMEQWLKQITVNDEFLIPPTPKDGTALGTTEAACGALLHQVTVVDGRMAQYQVLPASTWNLAAGLSTSMAGPLETALLGTSVATPAYPIEVPMVVRSFDSCFPGSIRCFDAKKNQLLAGYRL